MKDLIRVEQVILNPSGQVTVLNTNAQTTSGGGAVPFMALLLQASGIVGVGATPNIILSMGDIADGVNPVGTGGTTGLAGMLVVSRPSVFNGATWDRNREVTGDAQAATGIPVMHGTLWNGATYDREYAASAANLAAQSSKGANLATGPGNWTLVSAPATGVQATATKAAGAAGVRHVLTSIHAEINATAAQAPLSVVVRDGASGAGTIIWQARLSAQVTPFADSRVELSGLNLIGSAATAMTVEFTAAGVGTTFETLSATGYDAS
jgi:hypothetical protein